MLGIAVTGQRQIETRLSAAGLKPIGPDGVLPFVDGDVTHEERARRAFVMQKAGFFSGGSEPIKNDPLAIEYLFDLIEQSVRPNHGLKRATTIQWEFSDADPWHLRIDNGNTQAAAGKAACADVTFRTSLATWLAVVNGDQPIAKALLTRKLKPRGDVKTLLALPRVFETP